jgi:hypothetical protein
LVDVPLGYTDIEDTTCLHVPSIRLVVAGDAAYNGVRLHLAESNPQRRREWIAALDTIEALNPSAVIAGHKRAENEDSPRIIEGTRRYIRDFDRLAGTTTTARELLDTMIEIYPDRINRARSRVRRAVLNHKLRSGQAPPQSNPPKYVPSRCSNLIEECFSEISLRKRPSAPHASPDVSDHATEAGARQTVEVKTNSVEALGTTSPLGWRNRCGRSRAAGPLHIHPAITTAHPIPVAPGNCRERFGRGSRRGPSRSIWPQVDRIPAIRL